MRCSTAISAVLGSRPWLVVGAQASEPPEESREGLLARTVLSRAFVQSPAATGGVASPSSPLPRRAADGTGEAPRARHIRQDDLLGGDRAVTLRHGSRGIRTAGQLPPSLHRGWRGSGDDRKRSRK